MLYYDTQTNTTTTRPHRQGIHFPCKPSRDSFPPNPSRELLAQYGFFPARDVKPDYDPEIEYVAPTGWQEGDGVYVRLYDIQPLDEDIAEANMREKRDALLVESDCRALPDFPHADGELAAWMAYRQALRDVTDQAGFPYEIDWPETPGISTTC